MKSNRQILFKSSDYKQFLRARLTSLEPFPVTQAALAKAAGCKASYLSQCLNGHVHLLPDQMHAMGEYLKLAPNEINFLLLLLHFERSGSAAHRAFLKRQLDQIRADEERLSNRLADEGVSATSTVSEIQTYYNEWFTIAVHMLCTIPGMGNAESIVRHIGILPSQAEQALMTLKKLGLVESQGGEFKATLKHLRLQDHDPSISRHHSNWRLQAALRSHPAPLRDLHYTAVYSLSRSDADELRSQLADMLLKVRKKVQPSKEECIVAFLMDWFHIDNS